jgi:hypothetical protein
MVVLVILLVLALAACAVLAALFVQARRAAALAAARAGTTEIERDGIRGELQAARAEVDVLGAELAQSREAAAATDALYQATGAELATARDEVAAGQIVITAQRTQIEGAEAALDAARDELAASQAALADAATASTGTAQDTDTAALWVLELARSERRWRLSVSPGLDVASPFDGNENPLRLAVEIEAAALREEVGTRTSVEWEVDDELAPEASLVVLRVCEELLNTAATAAETIDLRVATEGDDVIIDMHAVDEDGSELALQLPALPDGRVHLNGAGARLVTTPAR